MHFRQHIPGFVSTIVPSFETDDWDGNPDSIECIAKWRENPLFGRFIHFQDGNRWLVGVEFLGGNVRCVIGYCDGGPSPQIPVTVVYLKSAVPNH